MPGHDVCDFRLKAFSLHLLSSATVLTLILGSLYFGWYRWPGWHLTDVKTVVLVMVCVDVVLGPTLTLIIANKNKPSRELVRDIGIIVTVQLCALIYGSVSLWNGRPLYYAFPRTYCSWCKRTISIPQKLDAGRSAESRAVPLIGTVCRAGYGRRCRKTRKRAKKIVVSAVTGGDDVISMPKYFKPWEDGLTSLRSHLKKVDDVAYFAKSEKKKLKERMKAAGLPDDQLNTMPLTGRGHPLLAVFDPATLQDPTATLKAN